jgi:hypothetical protein
MLDLEGVWPTIRPVVHDQPVFDVFAADLLVELRGR